jgi:UDPglucose 6-dehydrogenase
VDDALRDLTASGHLRFTTDAAADAANQFAFVCVPTPLDRDGLLDTSIVESVVTRLRGSLPADATIAVRSTLPLHGPQRLAEVVAASAGAGPAVVVNPEFMREGHALTDAGHPSRVVVGWLDPAGEPSARAVAELYAPLEAPTIVGDARSMVLIKLASNVFLGMKIAFADELARLSDAVGADVATVVDGLGLDPRIGRSFLDAGPGFGGSCLPEQAAAIAVETARRDLRTPLLSSIAESNDLHQVEIVRALGEVLEGGLAGKRVGLLGLAFKANTDDVRTSPALAIARELRRQGAEAVAYDPVAAANARRADPRLETVPSAAAAVDGADAVLLVTEWAEFRSLDWAALAPSMRGDLVYDTRRVLDGAAVTAAGLRYIGLGQASGARTPVRLT